MYRMSKYWLIALVNVLLLQVNYANNSIYIVINNNTDYIFNLLLLKSELQNIHIEQREISQRSSQVLVTVTNITIELDIQNKLGTVKQADEGAAWITINNDYTLNKNYEPNKTRPYSLIYNKPASNSQHLVFDILRNL